MPSRSYVAKLAPIFFFQCYDAPPALHSFPTRRSSDLLHSGARMTVVTGNDGRFAFRSIPPGQYSIEGTRSGYVSELARSEEHTSELRSQSNLVCRLLLEKKKISTENIDICCSKTRANL